MSNSRCSHGVRKSPCLFCQTFWLVLNTKLFSNKIAKNFRTFGATTHSWYWPKAPLKGQINNMISMKNRKKPLPGDFPVLKVCCPCLFHPLKFTSAMNRSSVVNSKPRQYYARFILKHSGPKYLTWFFKHSTQPTWPINQSSQYGDWPQLSWYPTLTNQLMIQKKELPAHTAAECFLPAFRPATLESSRTCSCFSTSWQTSWL